MFVCFEQAESIPWSCIILLHLLSWYATLQLHFQNNCRLSRCFFNLSMCSRLYLAQNIFLSLSYGVVDTAIWYRCLLDLKPTQKTMECEMMRNKFCCPVQTLLDTTEHLAIRSVMLTLRKDAKISRGDTVERILSSLPQGPLCRPCLNALWLGQYHSMTRCFKLPASLPGRCASPWPEWPEKKAATSQKTKASEFFFKYLATKL